MHIKAYIETRPRGLKGFPFEVYRSSGLEKGVVITPAHYHNELELMLPQKGVTDLAVEGENITAVENTLYAINPGEVHAMYANTNSLYHAIVFPKSLLELGKDNLVYARFIEPLFEGRLCIKRQVENKEAVNAAKRIVGLSQNVSENAPLIIAELLRLFWLLEREGFLYPHRSVGLSPVHQAIDFMEKHYAEKLTLEKIANSAGLSPKYFCACFKKHTLTTAINYLNTLRVKEACRLLRQGASVTDAALLCGFDNISFFIKKFKEATGVTPLKYKKGC